MSIQPEALILRRCYPVPVTFADLRVVAQSVGLSPWPSTRRMEGIEGNVYRPNAAAWRVRWTSALKEATGALDEVYAVVDGREVQVATVRDSNYVNDLVGPTWVGCARQLLDLLEVADQDGYWERPHEVRINLETRPVSHDSVARAVMVGQEYAERRGDA